MATSERLTTLSDVKEWLSIPDDQTASDDLLMRLIDAASGFVLNWLNRDSFRSTEYTQNFKGNGSCSTLLRSWPVISVSSVGVLGQVVQPSTLGVGGLPSPNGYTISDPRSGPQSIDLWGREFCYRQSCQVIYNSGFQASESPTLGNPISPSTIIYYPVEQNGVWSEDLGVILNGVTLTVSTSPSPPSGTYYYDEWGNYAFNADAAGLIAVITYSYTPFDVSWATTELIGEWFKRKDRIGLLSKSLGGQETVAFSQKDMSETIKTTLQPFMEVVPI